MPILQNEKEIVLSSHEASIIDLALSHLAEQLQDSLNEDEFAEERLEIVEGLMNYLYEKFRE